MKNQSRKHYKRRVQRWVRSVFFPKAQRQMDRAFDPSFAQLDKVPDWFELLALVVVLVNTAVLAAADPRTTTSAEEIFDYFDYFFVAFFTVELLLRVIAFGARNTFRSWWHITDLFVVVIGVAGLLLKSVFPQMAPAVNSLRAVRTEVRVVLRTISRCLRLIVDVAALYVLFWLAGASWGVGLFKGRLSHQCVRREYYDSALLELSLYGTEAQPSIVNQTAEMDVPPFFFENETITIGAVRRLVDHFNASDFVCGGRFDTVILGKSIEWCGPTTSCDPTALDKSSFNRGLVCPYEYHCMPMGNGKSGQLSYDNFGSALLTTHALVTFEAWSDVSTVVTLSTNKLSIIYCFIVVLVGSLFMTNLLIAFLTMQFDASRVETLNELRGERALRRARNRSRIRTPTLLERLRGQYDSVLLGQHIRRQLAIMWSGMDRGTREAMRRRWLDGQQIAAAAAAQKVEASTQPLPSPRGGPSSPGSPQFVPRHGGGGPTRPAPLLAFEQTLLEAPLLEDDGAVMASSPYSPPASPRGGSSPHTARVPVASSPSFAAVPTSRPRSGAQLPQLLNASGPLPPVSRPRGSTRANVPRYDPAAHKAFTFPPDCSFFEAVRLWHKTDGDFSLAAAVPPVTRMLPNSIALRGVPPVIIPIDDIGNVMASEHEVMLFLEQLIAIAVTVARGELSGGAAEGADLLDDGPVGIRDTFGGGAPSNNNSMVGIVDNNSISGTSGDAGGVEMLRLSDPPTSSSFFASLGGNGNGSSSGRGSLSNASDLLHLQQLRARLVSTSLSIGRQSVGLAQTLHGKTRAIGRTVADNLEEAVTTGAIRQEQSVGGGAFGGLLQIGSGGGSSPQPPHHNHPLGGSTNSNDLLGGAGANGSSGGGPLDYGEDDDADAIANASEATVDSVVHDPSFRLFVLFEVDAEEALFQIRARQSYFSRVLNAAPTRVELIRFGMERILNRSVTFELISLSLSVIGVLGQLIQYEGQPAAMETALNTYLVGACAVLFSIEWALRLLAAHPIAHATQLSTWVTLALCALEWTALALGRREYTALRSLRLLTVESTLRFFPKSYRWLSVLKGSFWSSLVVVMLIVVDTFIVALVGLHVLGASFCLTDLEPDTDPYSLAALLQPSAPRNGPAPWAFNCEGNPRDNFDTFGEAILTAFQLIAADGWHDTMYRAMAVMDSTAKQVIVAIIFVFHYLLAVMLLVNVFVAILVGATESLYGEEEGGSGGGADGGVGAGRAATDGAKAAAVSSRYGFIRQQAEAEAKEKSEQRRERRGEREARRAKRRSERAEASGEGAASSSSSSDYSSGDEAEAGAAAALRAANSTAFVPQQQQRVTPEAENAPVAAAADTAPSTIGGQRRLNDSAGKESSEGDGDDGEYDEEKAKKSGRKRQMMRAAASGCLSAVSSLARRAVAAAKGLLAQWREDSAREEEDRRMRRLIAGRVAKALELKDYVALSDAAGYGLLPEEAEGTVDSDVELGLLSGEGADRPTANTSGERRSRQQQLSELARMEAAQRKAERQQRIDEAAAARADVLAATVERPPQTLRWRLHHWIRVRRAMLRLTPLPTFIRESLETEVLESALWLLLEQIAVLCCVGILFADNTSMAPDTQIRRTIRTINSILTVYFSAEICLQIFARGFLRYYASSPVINILCTAAAVVGIVELALQEAYPMNLVSVKVVFLFRTVRLLMRLDTIALIWASVVWGFVPLRKVVFIALVVFLGFASAGMMLFGGKFGACDGTLDVIDGDDGNDDGFISTRAECEANGFSWVTEGRNFDNAQFAFECLGLISATEKWGTIMYAGIDSTRRGEAPEENHSIAYSLYFITFVFVGSFFLVNLFGSVLIYSFETRKAEEQQQRLQRTDPQERWWAQVKSVCDSIPAEVFLDMDGEMIAKMPRAIQSRLYLHRARRNRWYTRFIVAVTVLGAIAGFAEFAGAPPWLDKTLSIMYDVHAGIFALDAAIGIYSLGWFMLVASPTNRFELVVAAGLAADVALRHLAPDYQIGNVFRFIRLFRVIRSGQTKQRMRDLAGRLGKAMSSLAVVTCFLFIFILLASLVANKLFSRLSRLQNGLSPYRNFETIPNSIFLALTVVVGSDWEEVMAAGSVGEPDCDANIGECGYPYLAPALFFLYIVIGNYCLFNIFVATIIGSFEQSASVASSSGSSGISEYDVVKFVQAWIVFDKHRTFQIGAADFLDLLESLPRGHPFRPVARPSDSTIAGFEYVRLVRKLRLFVVTPRAAILQAHHAAAGNAAAQQQSHIIAAAGKIDLFDTLIELTRVHVGERYAPASHSAIKGSISRQLQFVYAASNFRRALQADMEAREAAEKALLRDAEAAAAAAEAERAAAEAARQRGRGGRGGRGRGGLQRKPAVSKTPTPPPPAEEDEVTPLWLHVWAKILARHYRTHKSRIAANAARIRKVRAIRKAHLEKMRAQMRTEAERGGGGAKGARRDGPSSSSAAADSRRAAMGVAYAGGASPNVHAAKALPTSILTATPAAVPWLAAYNPLYASAPMDPRQAERFFAADEGGGGDGAGGGGGDGDTTAPKRSETLQHFAFSGAHSDGYGYHATEATSPRHNRFVRLPHGATAADLTSAQVDRLMANIDALAPDELRLLEDFLFHRHANATSAATTNDASSGHDTIGEIAEAPVKADASDGDEVDAEGGDGGGEKKRSQKGPNPPSIRSSTKSSVSHGYVRASAPRVPLVLPTATTASTDMSTGGAIAHSATDLFPLSLPPLHVPLDPPTSLPQRRTPANVVPIRRRNFGADAALSRKYGEADGHDEPMDGLAVLGPTEGVRAQGVPPATRGVLGEQLASDGRSAFAAAAARGAAGLGMVGTSTAALDRVERELLLINGGAARPTTRGDQQPFVQGNSNDGGQTVAPRVIDHSAI